MADRFDELKTCLHLVEFDLLQFHHDAMRNYIHRS